MGDSVNSPSPSAPAGAGGNSPPRIPDHELIRLIGQGSYGQVWLARSALGLYRAIKVVYRSTFRDERPFQREFSGVQKFEPVSRAHEGLMDILQVGRNEKAGFFYYVMELADDVVSGQSIAPESYVPRTLAQETLKHNRQPLEICLRVGMAISSALDFLHSRGLIHRDVKPSNIVFIGGAPKLADIGLVAEMTEARSYVGTEGFIPPEGPGTPQADIYSLGKVLYEISTGRDRHDYPELPTLLDDTIHDREWMGLNKIILNACRTEPRQRYRSAREMAADLSALQRGDVPPRERSLKRRRIAAKAAGVFVCLAVVLAILLEVRSARIRARAIPATAGLVSWWRAEGDAQDSVNKNTGILRQGAGFSPGKVGKAFSFDGVAGYVEITNSPSLNPTGSFSIACWIYPRQDAPSAGVYPVIKWSDHGELGNQRSYALGLQPGGVVSFHIADYEHQWDGAFQAMMTDPGVLTLEAWNHIVAAYDQNTGTRHIYVNGVEAKARTDSPITILNGKAPLTIGAWKRGEGLIEGHFDGMIDEVALYGRALSAHEVHAFWKAVRTDHPSGPNSHPGSPAPSTN